MEDKLREFLDRMPTQPCGTKPEDELCNFCIRLNRKVSSICQFVADRVHAARRPPTMPAMQPAPQPSLVPPPPPPPPPGYTPIPQQPSAPSYPSAQPVLKPLPKKAERPMFSVAEERAPQPAAPAPAQAQQPAQQPIMLQPIQPAQQAQPAQPIPQAAPMALEPELEVLGPAPAGAARAAPRRRTGVLNGGLVLVILGAVAFLVGYYLQTLPTLYFEVAGYEDGNLIAGMGIGAMLLGSILAIVGAVTRPKATRLPAQAYAVPQQ